MRHGAFVASYGACWSKRLRPNSANHWYNDARMNYRQTIAEAWEYTREHKRIMWWFSFIPSLLTTLVGIFYLVYQFYAFKRSRFFDNAEHSFLSEFIGQMYRFLSTHDSLWIPAVIVTAIVLLLYAFLPTICQGALINTIARHKRGEPTRVSLGLSLGLLAFLPLLEYHLLIKTFSTISLLTEAGFAARNLDAGTFNLLIPVFILVLIIGFILTLFFTYAEFYIIIDKKNILRAMISSTKLVLMSWKHTFLVAILMIIIGVRVIINIVAVLLVPLLLFVSAGLVATVTFAKLGLIIGIIMSIAALIATSYFTGIINLFANTVWTFTFLALREEKDIKDALNE